MQVFGCFFFFSRGVGGVQYPFSMKKDNQQVFLLFFFFTEPAQFHQTVVAAICFH